MTRAEQVAYAAGFFDGEGHIRIQRHSKRGSYMLSISAVQATPEPVEFLKKVFGGTVKKRAMVYRNQPKAMFTWQASSKLAGEILKEMMPYLIAKADEADLAMVFRATFRAQYGDRSKNPPELETKREAMMYDLQEMRKRKRESHIAA
jgi:hypothetical protein